VIEPLKAYAEAGADVLMRSLTSAVSLATTWWRSPGHSQIAEVEDRCAPISVDCHHRSRPLPGHLAL